MLNQEIQILMEKRRKRRRGVTNMTPTSYNVSASSMSKPKKSKSKNPEKKKKKRPYSQSSDDEQMPETEITYEQKRELSDNINILPPEKLPQIFEIIKENTQLNVIDFTK
jgi:hypothetical protein